MNRSDPIVVVFLAWTLGSMAAITVPAAEPEQTKSFIYKKTKQADLDIVIHFPPGWKESDKRPAIVFFFGGGWMGGSIRQFGPQASHLASRGMVAARANYRVKSRHGVTPKECVEDAKSAVRWLRQNAAKLGVDPDRIVAAGGSAGGHIAACTALTPGLEVEGEDTAISSKPNALVLFNPVLRFDGIAQLMAMIGNDEEVGKAISPMLHLKKDSPPTLIFFGTADRLKAMGDEYLKRSKELSHRAEMFTAEGQPHGFFNRSLWQERTLRRADEFLVSLGYIEGKPTMKDQAESPALAITAKKPADEVTVTVENDTATLDVTSVSGIGGATVTLTKGKWPATVVLRLHLSGLESFAVSNGKIKLTGSVLSHSGNTKRLYVTEVGNEGEREPGTQINVFDAQGIPVTGLPDNDWHKVSVDVAKYVKGKTNVTLAFRLLDKKGVSNFGVRWRVDQLRGENLQLAADMSQSQKWQVSRQGAFETGFGSLAKVGQRRFHVPFISMTAGNESDYRVRHGEPATPERVGGLFRVSLQAWRDGKCDGVVTYCLDKRPQSTAFPPVRKVFHEFDGSGSR